eukprot:TRINITY_DN102_c10_g1_i1.p1 TRINITY_DN102_c10_g1~~TRINITY_DN102_c10_g1_i1.p1  ORF type:complete len:225 (+),score=45.45 TRINITY_DN102_c10_g1_i1:51-725(+)
MRRGLTSLITGQRRFAAAASWKTRTMAPAPEGGIFGNGWDNHSLEIVFRSIIKRPHIRELLKNHYAWASDEETLSRVKELGENCDVVQIQLQADITDPHRILKQYSIMDAPVIDIDGKHVSLNGGPVYYDDDGTKIAIVDHGPVEILAKEILWTLGYSVELNPSPKDARRFLEDIYGDATLPDDVLQPTGYLTDESLLYPEDVWPEVFKGGPRYGKYQRGLGDH